MNVIDHMGLDVSDFGAALEFYKKALAPLDIGVVMQLDPKDTGGYEGAGLGRNGKPSLWLAPGKKTAPRLHIAFVADSRAKVDAFYKRRARRRRHRQRTAGATPALPPSVLRRLRPRPGRAQYRGGLPHAGMIAKMPDFCGCRCPRFPNETEVYQRPFRRRSVARNQSSKRALGSPRVGFYERTEQMLQSLLLRTRSVPWVDLAFNSGPRASVPRRDVARGASTAKSCRRAASGRPFDSRIATGRV